MAQQDQDLTESIVELLHGKPIDSAKPLFDQIFTALPRDKKGFTKTIVRKSLVRKLKEVWEKAEVAKEKSEESVINFFVDPQNFDVSKVVIAQTEVFRANEVQTIVEKLYETYFGEKLNG